MSVPIDIFKEIQSEFEFIEDIIEKNENNSITKRVMVRSTFSGIESIASAIIEFAKTLRAEQVLNIMVHETNHNEIHKSFFEICALNEMSFRIDDKGEVKILPLKTDLKSRILFSLKILSKALNNELDPKKIEGWSDFLKGIKIRNRITHPKTLADLTVSDEEYDIIIKSLQWVIICHHRACGGTSY